MNDFLMAVALFGIASFILTFIYDGEFGDACGACLGGFGLLFGTGLVLKWLIVLSRNASDSEKYMHSAFFGRATIVGWVYLVVVVVCVVALYRKRAAQYREEKKIDALQRGAEKCELRKRNPQEYCRVYGHAEDDDTCVCSVCGAVAHSERHRVLSGSCCCSICKTVLYPENHRMRPGSCGCTVCGNTIHEWHEVGEDYTESERGDKLVVYYECSVCGAKNVKSSWYPK